MGLNPLMVFGSAIVGFLVGLTGMGGGALMTPMLVLLFGVSPSSAITSDLVAALFMKPAGVVVHWRRGTIHGSLVRYLCYGSLPGAFAGTFALHLMGHSAGAERNLEIALGAALIVGGLAMGVRSVRLGSRPSEGRPDARPVLTVALGLVGGFMVGLTSVGAGSLILVLLLVLYPGLRNDQLVGTDLAQSVPLTLSATAGTLLFNHVDFAVTSSVILGSVPAVIVGSMLSAHANGVWLRRVIAAVVLLSGLKYVGAPTSWLAGAALIEAGALVVMTLAGRRSVAQPVERAGAALPARFDTDA